MLRAQTVARHVTQTSSDEAMSAEGWMADNPAEYARQIIEDAAQCDASELSLGMAHPTPRDFLFTSSDPNASDSDADTTSAVPRPRGRDDGT